MGWGIGMINRIICLFVCCFVISFSATDAFAERMTLHDTFGAGGLADGFNKCLFKNKSVYITSCNRLPDFIGEEIYMLETNIGNLGDNIILVYPNTEGLMDKILILARKDSRLAGKMFDVLAEESICIFRVFGINSKEMVQMVAESLFHGQSSIWSINNGRRYRMETFLTNNNNIPFINVRIIAQR